MVKARLKLHGIPVDDGSFAKMNFLKKRMIIGGISPAELHVGYARAKGTFYCEKCESIKENPETDYYQGAEYWRCTCGKINFIHHV